MSRHAASSPPLDDWTVAYILDTRGPFEDLRRVASQLAGLLVLTAAGTRSAPPDHPTLEVARETFRDAADHVRHAQATDRSRRHHDHLLQAVTAFEAALAAACDRRSSGRPADIDLVLRPLRTAYAHLQEAADRLPGFELVAFAKGCCARLPTVEPLQVIQRLPPVSPLPPIPPLPSFQPLLPSKDAK
jgi:hypothetical protein